LLPSISQAQTVNPHSRAFSQDDGGIDIERVIEDRMRTAAERMQAVAWTDRKISGLRAI